MSEKRMAEIIDRLRGALQKDDFGAMSREEVRTLSRDAEELARRLRGVRSRYPNVPAANLSPHVFKVLRRITERYRAGSQPKKAANF